MRSLETSDPKLTLEATDEYRRHGSVKFDEQVGASADDGLEALGCRSAHLPRHVIVIRIFLLVLVFFTFLRLHVTLFVLVVFLLTKRGLLDMSYSEIISISIYLLLVVASQLCHFQVHKIT